MSRSPARYLPGQVVNNLEVLDYCLKFKKRSNGNYRSSYICVCLNCSELKAIDSYDMKVNPTCRCIQGEKRKVNTSLRRKTIDPYTKAIPVLYSAYKHSAKTRDIEFEIDIELFSEYIKLNCFYCNTPPSNFGGQHSKNGSQEWKIWYNGLDRVDNNIGYVKSNIIPCCKMCNLSKRSYNYDVFLRWVKAIYENLGLSGL